MRFPRVLGLIIAAFPVLATASAQLPDGYVDEPFLQGLDGPVGVVFDAGGRAFVWGRAGRVHAVENGALVVPPLLDISDEVGSWRDFGMLGFALDPEFLTNGLFYTYYVVDRHHLIHAGTPTYDPQQNEYFAATIGRITRFAADPATDHKTLLAGSRFVLLGETASTGVPILYESHGTGSLAIGADGMLLASSGDGANYGVVDTGSSPGTYWQQALADGIIRPEDNVGAFRAQMIGSLSGKMLRIDPVTGDGLPSNPFYDDAQPRSPRSRVWALGLRNPFRFSVRPGTGNSEPSLGEPGSLYIGDVGWSRWEDLHVVDGPGENLGWPIYEGMTGQYGYKHAETFNLDAPNPLHGQSGCDQPYFSFQELIKQEQADHNPRFSNPCDFNVQIAQDTPTFMHHRPMIDWRHGGNIARVPVYVDGKARPSELGSATCPVAGDPFSGWCAVGGTWLSPFGFGDFSGMFMQMDFSGNWMRGFRIDQEDRLLEVLKFGSLSSPVFAVQDPNDGSVIYISLSTNAVRRLRFTGSGNVAPQSVLSSELQEEGGTVAGRFDGSLSIDPEDSELSFHWDFGDGAQSDEPSPRHDFENPGGEPALAVVELIVMDEGQLTGQATSLVQLGNSAPSVQISSFANGALYSTVATTPLALEAIVLDAEHPSNSLSYSWQVFLRHDNHEHPEDPLTSSAANVLLSPTPCDGSFYAYRVELTVTDPLGAATRVNHWLLPDCQGAASVTVGVSAPNGRALPGIPILLSANASGLADRVDFHVDGISVASVYAPPYVTTWIPPEPGDFLASALVQAQGGSSASSLGLAIDVLTPARAEATIERVSDDAVESPNGQMRLNGETLDLGMDFVTGLRFPLEVPQGATIVSARLELTVASTGASATVLEIQAEATGNAPRLRGLPHNLSLREHTAESAEWDVEAWRYPLASGARQHTPELKAILQEVVDRQDWAPGNRVLFMLRGGGQRKAQAMKGQHARPARLVVEFDPGA